MLPPQADILDKLVALSSRIIRGATLEEALAFIYREFRSVVPYDRIGYADVDLESQTVTARWSQSSRTPQLRPGYSAPLAGSSLELVLKHRKPRIMNDLREYLARHPSSRSTQLITREGIRSSMTCPLFLNGKPLGFLFFSSEEPDTYNSHHVRILKTISNQLALLLMTTGIDSLAATERPVVPQPQPLSQPLSQPQPQPPPQKTDLPVTELLPGMIVGRDVVLENGRVFIASGVELTGQTIARLIALESQGFFTIGSVHIR